MKIARKPKMLQDNHVAIGFFAYLKAYYVFEQCLILQDQCYNSDEHHIPLFHQSLKSIKIVTLYSNAITVHTTIYIIGT